MTKKLEDVIEESGLSESVLAKYEELVERLKEEFPDVDWVEGYEALEDDEEDLEK